MTMLEFKSMSKPVWHTDIVVNGQGLGLKISPERSGCYRIELKPDTPGPAAARAKKKFLKAANVSGACHREPGSLKKAAERGVKKTRARWNRWHRESY
jgi:hypothetical protein